MRGGIAKFTLGRFSGHSTKLRREAPYPAKLSQERQCSEGDGTRSP
jgi:hypothetical protein